MNQKDQSPHNRATRRGAKALVDQLERALEARSLADQEAWLRAMEASELPLELWAPQAYRQAIFGEWTSERVYHEKTAECSERVWARLCSEGRLGMAARCFDEERRSALHHAALGARPIHCAQLIAAGASPDLEDRGGETALSLAYYSRSAETMLALLEKGARPVILGDSLERAFERRGLSEAPFARQALNGWRALQEERALLQALPSGASAGLRLRV